VRARIAQSDARGNVEVANERDVNVFEKRVDEV
jgi:hypothetical protein